MVDVVPRIQDRVLEDRTRVPTSPRGRWAMSGAHGYNSTVLHAPQYRYPTPPRWSSPPRFAGGGGRKTSSHIFTGRTAALTQEHP